MPARHSGTGRRRRPQKKTIGPGLPRGRPTKLTPELQALIVATLKAGNYVETAAAVAGITKDTIYAWLKRGARAHEGKLRDFSDAVAWAMGRAELDDVELVHRHGKTDWRAIAWHLERRFPARWGRKDRLDVIERPGAPLPEGTDAADYLEDPEVRAHLDAAAARMARAARDAGSPGGTPEPGEVDPGSAS